MTTLRAYIESIGDAQAAALFGVSKRTAASWRQGVRQPRAAKANEIVEKSAGKITLDGIYAAGKKLS